MVAESHVSADRRILQPAIAYELGTSGFPPLVEAARIVAVGLVVHEPHATATGADSELAALVGARVAKRDVVARKMDSDAVRERDVHRVNSDAAAGQGHEAGPCAGRGVSV